MCLNGCLPCNCCFAVHPGSTSTAAAQLVNHSELVRAAARSLAMHNAVNPQALATAAAAMAHVGGQAGCCCCSACLDLERCFVLGNGAWIAPQLQVNATSV